MTAYLAVLFIIPIIAIISTALKNKSDRRGFQLVLYFFLLFLVSCLRKDTVGGDLQRYLPEYADISQSSFIDVLLNGYGDREWGYVILEKLFSLFLPSQQGFLIWTSFMFLWLIFRTIKKESSSIWFSVFIFVASCLFTNSLNIIRASLATAIGLYSFKYVKNQEFYKFLLCVIAAFLIQRTALFLLPIYFIWKIKFSNFKVAILLLTSFIASRLLSGNALISIVNKYLSLYEISDTGYLSNNPSGITPYAVFLLILLILGILVYKKGNGYDKNFEFLLYMLAVALSIQFFASVFSLLNRISVFYSSYMLLYLPALVDKFTKESRLPMYIIICSIFTLFFITSLSIDPVTKTDTQAIIPYRFFWQ